MVELLTIDQGLLDHQHQKQFRECRSPTNSLVNFIKYIYIYIYIYSRENESRSEFLPILGRCNKVKVN